MYLFFHNYDIMELYGDSVMKSAESGTIFYERKAAYGFTEYTSGT